MKNNMKKTIAIVFSLIFLITIVDSTISKTLNVKNNEVAETKFITLYRYGLDEKVEEINVEICLNENSNIEELLQIKCQELFKNDLEFNSYLKAIENNGNNTDNVTNGSIGLGLYFVLSRGKGLHIQSKILGKILLRMIFKKLNLPKALIRFRNKLIACSYANDKAFTHVRPIISLYGDKNATSIYGSHVLVMTGFRGYTTWFTRGNVLSVFPKSVCGFCKSYVVGQ